MYRILFFLLSTQIYIAVLGQSETVRATYNIHFNQKFDQPGSDIREYRGELLINDATRTEFYMIPDKISVSTEDAIEIYSDTVWRVRLDLERQELFFDDLFNEKLVSTWYSDSLYPMRWVVGEETALIDSLQCTRATCDFRGRTYIAWFSMAVSLPFGPWKLGGLPGLIVKVEDLDGNLTMILSSIKTNYGLWQLPTPRIRSYADYIKSGNQLRKAMKLSMRTSDCVDCESKVKFHSWEKVFEE